MLLTQARDAFLKTLNAPPPYCLNVRFQGQANVICKPPAQAQQAWCIPGLYYGMVGESRMEFALRRLIWLILILELQLRKSLAH